MNLAIILGMWFLKLKKPLLQNDQENWSIERYKKFTLLRIIFI